VTEGTRKVKCATSRYLNRDDGRPFRATTIAHIAITVIAPRPDRAASTRTGSGTYRLNTPSVSTSSTIRPDPEAPVTAARAGRVEAMSNRNSHRLPAI
jgi:hypothetical protein